MIHALLLPLNTRHHRLAVSKITTIRQIRIIGKSDLNRHIRLSLGKGAERYERHEPAFFAKKKSNPSFRKEPVAR